MGVVNLAFPPLRSLDAVLGNALPPTARLALWGFVAAALSMGIYWLLSNQGAIENVKAEAAASKRDLASHEGGFRDLFPLAGRVFLLSGRHVRLVAVPTLISVIPVAILAGWLLLDYNCRFPVPGETVGIAVEPASAAVRLDPRPGASDPGGPRTLTWPDREAPVQLLGPDGVVIAELPPAMPVPVIGKREWWNTFLANPAGYIPEESTVAKVMLDLPHREYVGAGPPWARSWAAVFFPVLIVSSLGIKFLFRIK